MSGDSDTEAYDWVFDYSLVFLESDKFDAAVMDFVDEVSGVAVAVALPPLKISTYY